jgi:Tir chaperone protein (CesT) family
MSFFALRFWNIDQICQYNGRFAKASVALNGWPMHFEDLYLNVLREFVTLVGADSSALELGSEVSFEFDGMKAEIFMHPMQEALVVDVTVLQLSEPMSDPASLERMLLLHQLNSVTRFTHGAQAHVSVDHTLMLSHSFPVAGLSGRELASLVGKIIDSALELRTMWNDLQSLISQERNRPASSSQAATLIMPGHFA